MVGGHLPCRWFRHHIWQPATTAAQLPHTVRFHDLRHVHASWLLADGADIQTVKERLGNGGLRTTEKYLHTLPDTDNTALDAMNRTRNRQTNRQDPGPPICATDRRLFRPHDCSDLGVDRPAG